jgi:hypothetical protein
MLSRIGGMLSLLATEMSFEYLAPVFAGDTVNCTVTINEKDRGERQVAATAGFVNQEGAECSGPRSKGSPAGSAWRAEPFDGSDRARPAGRSPSAYPGANVAPVR